jgi:periplasmic copper chaperone A
MHPTRRTLNATTSIRLPMNDSFNPNEKPGRGLSSLARLCALLLTLLLPALSSAQSPPVQVSKAWARATVPGQKVAGVYLEIRSPRDAKIVAVKSSAGASAEIHSMSNDGGVMRMRELEVLPLPAGETVELKPGGNHIMLLDIKRQLKPGDKVPVTLIVEEGKKKRTVKVDAEVREGP